MSDEKSKTYHRRRYLKNRDQFLQRAKERYERLRDQIIPEVIAREKANPTGRARGKAHRWSLRMRVIQGYGGRCACCGERAPEFLTLHHVNEDGTPHRAALNRGMAAYVWAEKAGFPDSLKLLCWNCHASLGWRGYCPHEAIRGLAGELG